MLMSFFFFFLRSWKQSATVHDSLAGTFVYKPFDVEVDWSFVAKASPCYITVRMPPHVLF